MENYFDLLDLMDLMEHLWMLILLFMFTGWTAISMVKAKVVEYKDETQVQLLRNRLITALDTDRFLIRPLLQDNATDVPEQLIVFEIITDAFVHKLKSNALEILGYVRTIRIALLIEITLQGGNGHGKTICVPWHQGFQQA